MKNKSFQISVLGCLVVVLLTASTRSWAKTSKWKWEALIGMHFLHEHPHIYARADGMDTLLSQYSQYYQGGINFVGKVQPMTHMLPVQIGVNYEIAADWFLKAGVEISMGKKSFQKTATVSWDEFSETHQTDFQIRLFSLMPTLGLEKRWSFFSLYGQLGLNFFKFQYRENYRFTDSDYWQQRLDSYKSNSILPSAILGAKFTFSPHFTVAGRNLSIEIKLEYLISNCRSLSGSQNTLISDSNGQFLTLEKNGDFYSLEYNPFDIEWFSYWARVDPNTTGDSYRNLRPLGLNLSAARVMLGISF